MVDEKLRQTTVDRLDVKPLYRQIADDLRARIVSGALRSDDRLPSEEVLARSLHVSRKTVRQALGCLEMQGYLSRRRGHGTFVRQPQGMRRIAIVTDTEGATGASTFQAIVSGAMLALTAADLLPGLHLADQLLQADGELAGPDDLAAIIAVRCQPATVDALLAASGPRGVPVVVEGQESPRAAACVVLDSAAGMDAAVAHLLALGHRRFGLFSYAPHLLPDAPNRERSARAAIESGGAVVLDGWHRLCDTLAPADVTRWTAAQVARPDRPSAIVTTSDTLAAGLLHVATAQGISIPAELSVTGFDDLPMCAYLHPALTTVRQDYGALGTLAARTVVRCLAGDPDVDRVARLRPGLVVRESCGRC